MGSETVPIALLFSGAGLLGVASLWGGLPRRPVVLGMHAAFQVLMLGRLVLEGALRVIPVEPWQFALAWAVISLFCVTVLLAGSRDLAALLLACGFCPSAYQHSPAAHLVQALQGSPEGEVARQVRRQFFLPKQLAERLAREGR